MFPSNDDEDRSKGIGEILYSNGGRPYRVTVGGGRTYWVPDAPGNTPGPYGGYYDINGKLHCKADNMPTDEHGAPLISFYTETGTHRLTYEEDLAYRRETERIFQGGDVDYGLTEEEFWNLRD